MNLRMCPCPRSIESSPLILIIFRSSRSRIVGSAIAAGLEQTKVIWGANSRSFLRVSPRFGLMCPRMTYSISLTLKRLSSPVMKLEVKEEPGGSIRAFLSPLMMKELAVVPRASPYSISNLSRSQVRERRAVVLGAMG